MYLDLGTRTQLVPNGSTRRGGETYGIAPGSRLHVAVGLREVVGLSLLVQSEHPGHTRDAPAPPRSVWQWPDEFDAVVLACLLDHGPLDRFGRRQTPLPRRESDRAVELAVAGRRKDEIARRF